MRLGNGPLGQSVVDFGTITCYGEVVKRFRARMGIPVRVDARGSVSFFLDSVSCPRKIDPISLS